MQFKHPELLYALFALLIPIIVHLFQLRKFKKQAFTNVAFLKKVKLETRKSSQIKKWLTLITRMLLLACIIFAFAQPYYAQKGTFKTKKETVVYLDNSYSMQAKGETGELLKRAVQDLIDQGTVSDQISVFTNDQTFKDVTIKGIQKELLNLEYSANQLDEDAVLLKIKKLFSEENSEKNVVWVSDFQQKEEPLNLKNDSTLQMHLVQLKPETTNNLSIDSLYLENKTASEAELLVQVKGEINSPTPISLYEGETLIGKTTVTTDQSPGIARFTLPTNDGINGTLKLDDNQLQFDNTFFFSINKNKKVHVLSINQASDDFLRKIYTDEEFNYTSSTLENLNYSTIENQNLIVLNELPQIPISLSNTLRVYVNNGGVLAIIPSSDIDLESYNALTSNSQIRFLSKSKNERKITTINFSHPLFSNVFNKQVSNFQYPHVKEFYALSTPNSNPLQFEDSRPFLTSGSNMYVFSASINTENSNFKSSPLIVPTLYNIGKQSLKIASLYHTIGQPNTFDIAVKLKQDEIITLSKEGQDVIPQQQYFNNKVVVKTDENPQEAGIYAVKNKEALLEYASFNGNRSESQLIYNDLSNLTFAKVSNSLNETLESIKSNSKINELWKWFVIFALVFLVLEILILKYFK